MRVDAAAVSQGPHRILGNEQESHSKQSHGCPTSKETCETMTRNGKGAHKDGYVQLPGMRLHYIDYGGSGETIIALHGLIQNARAFDAIVPALVPHVRLIALDLRGRGGSDWSPSDSYRWTYYLNDLRGFFQALRIPTVCVAWDVNGRNPGDALLNGPPQSSDPPGDE